MTLWLSEWLRSGEPVTWANVLAMVPFVVVAVWLIWVSGR